MNHKHIDNFNPDVRLLTESYQDFLIEKINEFDAGRGYETFNEFIKLEAKETRDNGEGVSYVVWNVWYDESKRECTGCEQ